MRKPMRRALTFGAAMLATALPLTLASAGSASADTISNGTVSLNTSGPVAPGPYSSGQSISISVGPNSTMDNANLAAAGFPYGAVAIKAYECADLNGDAAGLPTNASECQKDTVASISSANSDGSMYIGSYPVYALPDNILLGEAADATPVCGTFPNACVVGLFSNVADFSKPHIFSAPFLVSSNSDDGGESPGGGGGQAISFTSPPPSGAKAGGSYTPSITGGGSGNPIVLSIASGGCSVSGSTVHFTGAGLCVIHADQAGSADYLAAPTASQTVYVGFIFTTSPILPPATRGASYNRTIHVQEAPAPIKFKTIGKLPKGLKLNKSSGTISGIPKTKHVNAGTYHFSVQVQSKKTKTVAKQTITESFTLQLL